MCVCVCVCAGRSACACEFACVCLRVGVSVCTYECMWYGVLGSKGEEKGDGGEQRERKIAPLPLSQDMFTHPTLGVALQLDVIYAYAVRVPSHTLRESPPEVAIRVGDVHLKRAKFLVVALLSLL